MELNENIEEAVDSIIVCMENGMSDDDIELAIDEAAILFGCERQLIADCVSERIGEDA